MELCLHESRKLELRGVKLCEVPSAPVGHADGLDVAPVAHLERLPPHRQPCATTGMETVQQHDAELHVRHAAEALPQLSQPLRQRRASCGRRHSAHQPDRPRAAGGRAGGQLQRVTERRRGAEAHGRVHPAVACCHGRCESSRGVHVLAP